MYDLHGTECGFVHKRLFRGAASFVTSGFSPTAAAAGFLSGGGGQPTPTARRPRALSNLGLADARRREITTAMRAATKRGDHVEAAAFLRELGTQGPLQKRRQPVPPIPQVAPVIHRKLGRAIVDRFAPCPPGQSRGSGRRAKCSPDRVRPPLRPRLDLSLAGVLPGGPPLLSFGRGGGQVVMGRYGAGMQPEEEMRRHRECLPGMVLGDDGVCYNRRDIRNSEREWPKGRRPLGTPGEMAALSKAAAFGKRMETTVKRMQGIGVLKKPKRIAVRRPATAQRQIGPGPSIINVE